MERSRDHLQALVRKGFLRRSSSARSLEVLRDPCLPGGGEGDDDIWHPAGPRKAGAGVYSRLIPVLGDVAAGRPILAVENVEDSWFLDRKLLKGANNFLLRVRGESMSGAQIEDGDYLLIRPQPTAESGEIVVAMAGDEGNGQAILPAPGRDRTAPRKTPLTGRYFTEKTKKISPSWEKWSGF